MSGPFGGVGLQYSHLNWSLRVLLERIKVKRVSVINVELIPDVFQLQSCHSTFYMNINEEKKQKKRKVDRGKEK